MYILNVKFFTIVDSLYVCITKLIVNHNQLFYSNRKNTDYNELPPPSYVQSLINKIVGNLSVTCNNVILKYIEDDIVLSMNIKSITLDSCNSNWIPDIIGKYYN